MSRGAVADVLAIGMLTAIIAAGCGQDAASRPEVLARLADETVVPAYERLSASAEALERSAEVLCAAALDVGSGRSGALADARSGLDGARAALAGARAHWSFSQPMWAGPVMQRRSWSVIDWPIQADEIESLIADNETVLDTDRLARGIGADQRGLRAVEYLLFTAGDDSSEGGRTDQRDDRDSSGNDGSFGRDREKSVVHALGARRRCRYLTGIASVIATEARLLHGDWAISWEDGPAYRDVFSAHGDGNGIDAVVNDSLFLLEAVTDRELGAALGLMDSPADVYAIEEGPAGLAAADLRDHLSGLRAVLVGDLRAGGDTAGGDSGREAGGLSPLLGQDLTKRLRDRLDRAAAALSRLRSPLRDAVAGSPEDVVSARDSLKAVQATVATEVVSRLGVTIGFSDADGDSAS